MGGRLRRAGGGNQQEVDTALGGGVPLADSSVCDRAQVAGGGLPFSANGRSLTSGMRSSSQPALKRQKLNPADAPNPVVFVATKDTRYGGTVCALRGRVEHGVLGKTDR